MSTSDVNVYREIARSIVASELEKIKNINLQRFPSLIRERLHELGQKLQEKGAAVLDRLDLIELKSQVNFVSELIDFFLESSPSRSSWWAMALIKECYEKCGIDHTQRHTLIIHSLNSEGYGVTPDILSFLPPDLRSAHSPDRPIDIFIIPPEAKHDIASISLIGHEIGHIYWSIHDRVLSNTLSRHFMSHYGAPNLFTQAELHEKRRRIASYIEEFLCDAVGRYLLGPAFDFALLKHFCSSPHDQNTGSTTHPPELSRIQQSFAHLGGYRASLADPAQCLGVMISYFKTTFEDELNAFTKTSDDEFSERVAETILRQISLNSPYDSGYLDRAWELVSPELNSFRPPFEKVSTSAPELISPTLAVAVTTMYYYGRFYEQSNDYYVHSTEGEEQKLEVLRDRMAEHLRYAVSVYDFVKVAQRNFCGPGFDVKELDTTLWVMRGRQAGSDPNPFVVTPSTDPKSQYSSNSVDLRLGTSFLINKTTGHTHISPGPSVDPAGSPTTPLNAFFEELFIPVGEEFILHPHQFVLAATLEYISVPYDFYALVLGRSSWGRLGLNIATATTVHSGFRGCITLELRNLGETPLPLKVGLRIAQLCLIPVPILSSHVGYFARPSKYIGPVGPEIPKIKEDSDWSLLRAHQTE